MALGAGGRADSKLGSGPAEKLVDSRMRKIRSIFFWFPKTQKPLSLTTWWGTSQAFDQRGHPGPRAKNRGPLRVWEDLGRAPPGAEKTRKSRNLEARPAHPLFA